MCSYIMVIIANKIMNKTKELPTIVNKIKFQIAWWICDCFGDEYFFYFYLCNRTIDNWICYFLWWIAHICYDYVSMVVTENIFIIEECELFECWISSNYRFGDIWFIMNLPYILMNMCFALPGGAGLTSDVNLLLIS